MIVIEIWGFVLCLVGFYLVIDFEGNFEGFVFGGCVEGVVVVEVVDVIDSGKLIMLEFGVVDEMVWCVGLFCGGRI